MPNQHARLTRRRPTRQTLRRAIALTVAPLLCAAALTTAASPAIADTTAVAGRLVAGDSLAPGATLWSPDGHYRLVMQGDGNLVEYVGGRPLWYSHTSGHPNTVLEMQSDGNLVLYDATHTAIWSAKTWGHPGAYMELRNDANIVVTGSGKTGFWASRAIDTQLDAGRALDTGWFVQSPNGAYRLVMQADGNLVLYRKRDMTVMWYAHTYGHPNSTLEMQGADGNLVVYSEARVPLWNTHTGGHPGTVLQVEDTGRIVLYAPGHVAIWASDGSVHGGYVIHDRENIAEVKAVANQMAADIGWGSPAELSCIDEIFIHESNWHWNADNPYSSAWGIPQAVPGSKMASAGADWHDNPVTQIKWGYGYIAERYGTPCGAWSFWQSHHWYSGGV